MLAMRLMLPALAFGAALSAAAATAQEQVVVNCTFELEWCEAVGAKFTEVTGIEALISRKTDGEVMAQLLAEGDNPRFDVWHPAGPDSAAIMAEEGLLDSYQSPMLAETHQWAQDAAAASGYVHSPLYMGLIGFGYNTELLEKNGMPEPKCWADLTNPAYLNEIQMADPSTSGTAYTMVTTILQLMGEDQGFEYLKQLHKNINQYTRSGAAGIRAAARGETTIGVAFLHDSVAQTVEGFPIKTVAPCEGSAFEMPGVSIVKNARNPEAARRWVDFALSVDAQNVSYEMGKYQIQSNVGAMIHPDAPSPEDVKMAEGYDIMMFANEEARTRILDRFESDVMSLPK